MARCAARRSRVPPIGRSAPFEWPASDARSLVLELGGDAPLVEVVTVRQMRRRRQLRDRGTRVELSLDDVDVVVRGRVVGRFVELEAELLQGNEDLLEGLATSFDRDPALARSTSSKLETALAAVQGNSKDVPARPAAAAEPAEADEPGEADVEAEAPAEPAADAAPEPRPHPTSRRPRRRRRGTGRRDARRRGAAATTAGAGPTRSPRSRPRSRATRARPTTRIRSTTRRSTRTSSTPTWIPSRTPTPPRPR